MYKFKEMRTLIIIISVAIVISAVIGGVFFYQAQKSENTIRSVGSASKNFSSDEVKWNVTLEAKTDPDQLKSGYQQINQQKEKLIEILDDRGVLTENLHQNPINVYENYNYVTKDGNQERVFAGYELSQEFYVISSKIDQIEEIVYNPESLFEEDIIIKNSKLQYFYSKIDELKKEIISMAAVNAGKRAEKMLENTEMELGKTLSLNSGIFQITEPYSTAVSSSGIHNTSTRKKQIRVTVHAVYQLK